MNLLDIFFVVSGIIILFLWIDVAKKERFNALHFLVFLCIGAGLLVFTLFPWALTVLGQVFWLQRGADLLVYISIIFLIYFVLLLLRKLEDHKHDITQLIREIALQNSSQKRFKKWSEIFVIPAYNEWKVLQNTIQTVLDAGYENIIVVNDGSRDNTKSILEQFSDRIIALHHYKNRGQWAALETGFEYIRRYADKGCFVITFDSDWQHKVEDIEVFRKHMQEDIDILLGSRFLSESQTNISFKKRFILKLGIIFTFFLSRIKLSDTHNGYRYMRSKVLDDIEVSLDGMWHASEIIDIIASKKIPYREVPVQILYTEYSLEKGQKISNAWNVLTRFIWSKFFR